MVDSVDKRAAQWAATENTGISSKAILAVMVGRPPKSRYCYPHDGGDLGRCIGLLDAVPEYRERLNEMKAIGPEWTALVEHWAELEKMWRSKDSALYARMKMILDPIERTNSNLIKIGNRASIYFGD